MDGKYLKRAAVLLFHADPEHFVTGAFVKIGYFRTNVDLLYHDEIHGDLFTHLREAVLNAILHKDYSAGTPVQISVYADRLMLWNPGISMETMALSLGLTRKGVEWQVRNLKQAGILRRVGSRKRGHWEMLGTLANPSDTSPAISD